jgi:hypothetical protein
VSRRWTPQERERFGAGRWPASAPEPVARTVGATILGGMVLAVLAWWLVWLAAMAYGVLLLVSIAVELGGWSLADRATTFARRLWWVLLRPPYLVGLTLLELFQIG